MVVGAVFDGVVGGGVVGVAVGLDCRDEVFAAGVDVEGGLVCGGAEAVLDLGDGCGDGEWAGADGVAGAAEEVGGAGAGVAVDLGSGVVDGDVVWFVWVWDVLVGEGLDLGDEVFDGEAGGDEFVEDEEGVGGWVVRG